MVVEPHKCIKWKIFYTNLKKSTSKVAEHFA